MLQDIHILLDECKSKTEALVYEIEQYKSAKEINQAAAASLDGISQALKNVIKQIRPFTDVRVRRFQITVLVWNLINSVCLIAIILILLLRNG